MTKSEKTLFGFVTIFLSAILWPSLPQITLIAFVCIVMMYTLLYRFSAVVAGMLAGILWVCVCGYYYLVWQIDDKMFNQNIIVEGTVVSLQAPVSTVFSATSNVVKPNRENRPHSETFKKNAIKFNFVVDKIGERQQLLHAKVRLSWYSPELSLQQGDRLRLFIRAKPPVGLANPNTFNYQKWLSSKNITALGYVRQSPSNKFIIQNASLRQRSVNALLQHDLVNIRWVLALSYGDRHLLHQDDWDLMQRTGTAHLFAISGMHLGIVFGFTLFMSKCLCYIGTLLPHLTLKTNLKPWLLVLPCVICTGYAFLAGFEIPVMRALMTLLLWTMLIVFSKHWRISNMLLLLLTSFFIFFPFSMLGISFWLSFIVVLVISLFLWRFKLVTNATVLDKIGHTIKLQFFISIVTLPMIAIAFSSLPITAFIANLFMIPVVTFVLVPLCLSAAIATSIDFETASLYWAINACFEYTFYFLNWLDDTTFRVLGTNWEKAEIVTKSMYWLQHPMIIFSFFLLILPPWYNKKSLILSIVSIVLLHHFVQNKHAHFEGKSSLYVMDVGQGSAIVVRDKYGTILYDTGGAFAGFSMANSVLLPFFESKGINKLDYFILSHLDNDHAGGATVITQNIDIQSAISPQNGCNRAAFLAHFPLGKAQYLGYQIQILWPLLPVSGDENNHSCVIKLQKGQHSILLTGDIEKASEAELVSLYAGTNTLKSTILIAPHHGSKTSSTLSFVNAVAPKYVVFSSGNNNRWGFPAQSVVNRYQSINAKIYITGQQGRIKFVITDKEIEVSTYRDDEYPRWFFKARMK
jgi:competence protein ComEC